MPYGDLTVYCGGTNWGNGSGRFYPPERSEWDRNRWEDALRVIEETLIPPYNIGFSFGDLRMFDSLEECNQLCDYAKSNIKGAEPIRIPKSFAHGRLSFAQIIRFNGWTKESLPVLVEELKKSGLKPRDRRVADWIGNTASQDPKVLEEYVRKNKIDLDYPWKERYVWEWKD